MSAISVREQRISDKAAIAKVAASAEATLRETYRPNARALENRAKLSRQLKRLVATVDGHVVGTIQFFVEDDCLRVIGLGVLSDHRRQGVARKLLDELANRGKDHGVRCLALHAVKETGNPVIFQKLGFRTISERADLFSESDTYEGLVDVYMERDL